MNLKDWFIASRKTDVGLLPSLVVGYKVLNANCYISYELIVTFPRSRNYYFLIFL